MPPFSSETITLASPAPNDTVMFMQDANDPWEMDLNTSVTIVFGILGLILQAGQICFGRWQIRRPSSENNVAYRIPNGPMSQRGETPLLQGFEGSILSRRPRQCSPTVVEAPPRRHAQQLDRTPGYYRVSPAPDVLRMRNTPQHSNRGQWGGASGSSGRSRPRYQSNNQISVQFQGQGYQI